MFSLIEQISVKDKNKNDMDQYLEQAIKEYERNISLGKTFYMDASVLMDIEEYYEKQGKRYEAEQLMRFAEKLHPNSEEVLVVKAYRARALGHWSEGLNIIRNIPNQQNKDVQLFYIEWDVASGRLDKAEKRIKDCLPPTMLNDDYDWFLDMGEMLLDYGYQQRALKYLLAIPQKYSLRTHVDELIADAYFQLQLYTKSIKAANRLVDANPYDTNAWTQLADIQQKCQKYAECIQSCDYALAINRNNQRAMSLKVFATFAMSDNKRGLALCLDYMKVIPDDYSIRMYAGEQLYAAGRIDEAKTPLQDALRLCPLENPDRVRIINDLVYLYISCNDIDNAEETMLSLAMLGNSLSSIYTQMGNICSEFKNSTLAISCYYKAIHSPKIEDNELLLILQLLVNAQYFHDALPLWHDIYNLLPHIHTTQPSIYAYMAIGTYMLNEKEAFNNSFELAAKFAADALKTLFSLKYPNASIDEIRNLANMKIDSELSEKD